MQGDGFATEQGRIMKVATWLCAPLLVGLWSNLGLVPNYVVLVLGNEGVGLSSHARLSYTGPMDWFKEARAFDFERSSNIQSKLTYDFLILMFSPKTT